jgi:hypothetical protein
LDEKNNHTPRQSSDFHRVLSMGRTEFAAMGYTNSFPGQFALEISAKPDTENSVLEKRT